MIKIIVGSFLGTFFALAVVGIVAVFAIDSIVDRVVDQISEQIQARRTELVAIVGCIQQHIESGKLPAFAVEQCMSE